MGGAEGASVGSRPAPADTGGFGGDVPSISDGHPPSGERGSKSMTSMDFLLRGESVRSNPYLRAFAAFTNDIMVGSGVRGASTIASSESYILVASTRRVVASG